MLNASWRVIYGGAIVFSQASATEGWWGRTDGTHVDVAPTRHRALILFHSHPILLR